MKEKRLFHRVGHDARLTLSRPGQFLSGRVVDLSLNGCLLELYDPRLLDPEQVYRLDIHLSPDTRIEMDGVLAHQNGAHAGFRRIGIDQESVVQLHRLVELNLGDSDLVERDMRQLIRG